MDTRIIASTIKEILCLCCLLLIGTVWAAAE